MGDDAPSRSQSAQATPQAAEVREFLEEVGRRLAALERDRRMGEIMDSAGQSLTPPRRRPKRDRHGLHIVRGCALLGVAGRWLVRSHAHRAVVAGLVAATAASTTLSPDMMDQAPAAQVPVVHRHEAAHHRRRDVDAIPPAVPARRTRRTLDSDKTARRAAVAPSPQRSPDPEPPGRPPRPACPRLTGKHCHRGDEVVVAQRALRGLT